MKTHTLIVAQGGGFYGSAICTSPRSVEEIKKILKVDDDIFLLEDEDDRECGGTGIMLVPNWQGDPQPNPIIVFDSGHASFDEKSLKLIIEKLK